MKKRISFVCVYLCLLTLLLLGAAELSAPDKGERFSSSENRMLAAFPALSAQSVADGSFMSGFETYLSDAFPFRDGAAVFHNALMGLVRIPDDDPATGVVDDAQLWEQSEEQEAAFQQLLEEERAAQGEEESAAEPTAAPRGEAREVTLWLLRRDGEKEVLFTYPADAMASFADILNRYRAKLPAAGRLYFLSPQVSDIANNIIGREKYVGWGTDLVDGLQPLVDDGVVVVDDLAILQPYLNDSPSPLYPANDYHWHAIAASLTADALASGQGLAPAGYDQYCYWLSSRHDNRAYSTEELAGMR